MSSATPSRSSIPSSVTKSPKSVRFKEDEDAPLKLSVLDKLSITHLLALGALFRFLLILYGVYHDSIHTLKYTDVDYFVFSDAAQYIVNPSVLAQGPLAGYIAEKYGIYVGSPYDRATYRYTPLLALLLLPNVNLQPLFGKFLFSAADSGIALLQYHSLSPATSSTSKASKEAIEQERTAKLLVGSIWILNPFVANISTRGSAESILGFIVILFLHLLQKNKINSAAIVFGLAVHLKLYPVIYASSVLAYLSSRGHLINLWQIRFAFISFGSFMLLNLAMYSLWGMPFVEHTYLYHLTRLDHRHNFSHYFYQIYLASAGSSPSRHSTDLSPIDIVAKIASSTFVPQLALSLGLGFFLTKSVESLNIAKRLTNSSLEERNSSNLPFVFLVQTMIFIAFNRVCTSQYFMWYLWFLPFVIPTLQNHKRSTDNHHKKRKISWKKGLVMLGSWIGAQALWLSTAYELEFLGRPVFRELWLAGVAFFIVNVGLVWILIDQL